MILKFEVVSTPTGLKIVSPQFNSKCDRQFCRPVKLYGSRRPEKLEECAICTEDLNGKELALLTDCDHIFCADCIRMHRRFNDGRRYPRYKNIEVHQCPMCRTYSRGAIYTMQKFVGRDKASIYQMHLCCLDVAYYISMLKESINHPTWLALLKFILTQRADADYPFRLDNVEFDACVTIETFEPNYVVYISKLAKSSFRFIAFCTYVGISMQLMFSSEPLSYDTTSYDNEYADKVAALLASQIKRLPPVLHSCLNPEFNRFLIWRKFDSFHCALKIDKLVKESPCKEREGILNDQLRSLLPHNFYEEFVESLSDDMVDKNDLMEYFDGDIRHNISRFMFPKIEADVEVREINLSNNRSFALNDF